jgi:hypothetical protein
MRTVIPMRRNLLVMLTIVATAQRDLAVLSPTSGLCQGFMSAVQSAQVLARQAKILANRHANNAGVSPSTNAYVVAAAKLTSASPFLVPAGAGPSLPPSTKPATPPASTCPRRVPTPPSPSRWVNAAPDLRHHPSREGNYELSPMWHRY